MHLPIWGIVSIFTAGGVAGYAVTEGAGKWIPLIAAGSLLYMANKRG